MKFIKSVGLIFLVSMLSACSESPPKLEDVAKIAFEKHWNSEISGVQCSKDEIERCTYTMTQTFGSVRTFQKSTKVLSYRCDKTKGDVWPWVCEIKAEHSGKRPYNTQNTRFKLRKNTEGTKWESM